MTTARVTPQWLAQQVAKATAPVVEGWRDGVLSIFVPGTPKHFKGKGHRYTVSKHTKDWRERTATQIFRYMPQVLEGGRWKRSEWFWKPEDPKAITFTIYTSGRGFDGVDNLKLVASPCLDALGPNRTHLRNGVEVRAHGMGLIDDDKNPAHDIRYEQVVKAAVPGIAVTIARRTDAREGAR